MLLAAVARGVCAVNQCTVWEYEYERCNSLYLNFYNVLFHKVRSAPWNKSTVSFLQNLQETSCILVTAVERKYTPAGNECLA